MKQTTEKITVSLPADTLQMADEKYKAFGFESRSDFINRAIREYISRDILRQFSGELAEIYAKIERSEIRNLEEHLSKLSYKIAVELAQINLLLASLIEVPYTDTQKLRGKAVRLVNQSRGYVPLKDAFNNKMDFKYLEDSD
ncbi:MAG: ribbon-helix-helix domain-containing protein [Eubacteriales bacterium]|nr:ribbon-helix-helix domain-containing protein [Eubacteriales bacterium]